MCRVYKFRWRRTYFSSELGSHFSTACSLMKLSRYEDGAELFVADLREFCPLDPSGILEITGPLLEFCYYFIGVDPHFGPLLDHYRVHRGFSETDNLVVLDHLEKRHGLGRIFRGCLFPSSPLFTLLQRFTWFRLLAFPIFTLPLFLPGLEDEKRGFRQ